MVARPRLSLALLLLLPLAAPAQPADGGTAINWALAPMPTDAQCAPLPPLKTPFAFGPGEALDYDVDAMGAKAARMSMRVLPAKDGAFPLEVHVETNTFFNKVRKVVGTGTSYMSTRTLRPLRYFEDATENEWHRVADVKFDARSKVAHLVSTINGARSEADLKWANEGLDVAGTIFLLRQLPLRKDLAVCFDAYGIRRLWRTWGRVEERVHVSLPLGEFDAWHIAGVAARLDAPHLRREIHVWISDDPRRLPLAAMGVIDLGAVRATLTGFQRPGDKRQKAEPRANLKW